MRHIFSLSILLSAVWLLVSGLYQPLPLLLGLGSVALVVWIAHRMDVADHEGVPVHLGPRVVGYWLWLLKEILRSNIDVARRVLSPGLPISPCVFEVEALQETALGQTIFANSITLAPGAVSMSMGGKRITIHALTEEARDELLEGTLNRKVLEFEKAA